MSIGSRSFRRSMVITNESGVFQKLPLEDVAYILHGATQLSWKWIVKVDTLKHHQSDHTIILRLEQKVDDSVIDHYRFGHINSLYLHHADLIMSIKNHSLCIGFSAGKISAQKYSKNPSPRANVYGAQKPLCKLHGDMIGPFSKSISGHCNGIFLLGNYSLPTH